MFHNAKPNANRPRLNIRPQASIRPPSRYEIPLCTLSGRVAFLVRVGLVLRVRLNDLLLDLSNAVLGLEQTSLIFNKFSSATFCSPDSPLFSSST